MLYIIKNMPEANMSALTTILLNYECPLIRVGQQKGDNGVIDFITEQQLNRSQAMGKGVDCIGRAFLAFKAEFVFESGVTSPIFVTLYQKYVNNKNIWACFNYAGMALFPSSAEPITARQEVLLLELLSTKSGIFNDTMIRLI